MYHSVLVPLDRSPLAEQALPLALSIARRASGRLDLVKVHALYALEDLTAAWLPYDPDRDAECRQQEQDYLGATAQWLTSAAPVAVTASVLSGSIVLPERVADSILEHAHTGHADLIVMATHGRNPLIRCGLGSVADQLVRRSPIPVLLVRPGEKAGGIIPEPDLDNILIPLDGSPLAEQILEPTLELARQMEAHCCLLRVVASSAETAQAEEYLECIAGKLREPGLEIRTRVVVAPRAVEAIVAEAAAQASNVIAVATHGRGGVNRLLLGSVADKLIRTAAAPVLVYRPLARGRESGIRSQGA
jgi:nucleotide-binding universal stress UspA family protein